MIIGVDLNPDKKAWGERFGMTHFVNPREVGGDLVAHLVNMTKSNADQWRRRLHIRMRRQRQSDAHGP
jgi:S-(hydroxymethyl)glutathione dehydrogenase/alcohol dehydrogenase